MINFFFFNDTATTEIYTLSLHDALPIWPRVAPSMALPGELVKSISPLDSAVMATLAGIWIIVTFRCSRAKRSEEHTSELQSQSNLVCRLLLEKKKTIRLRWTTLLRYVRP